MNTLPIKKNFVLILFGFFSLNLLHGQTEPNTEQIIYDYKYYSDYFGNERDYRIFLPPDYSINTAKRYPVIFFFHGYGGRYNGPYGTDPNGDMESRYYDAWTGNSYLCGPDSTDNIEEYVKNNDVIVVKWDGYVANQWPRPYNIGPVKDDGIQFVDYFPELVNYIDAHYRTIPTKEGRAVSGLSMGGFMSMFVASKYPDLISSASFFNPSAAFSIGNVDTQIYTEFKNMGINYIGLPIRMHLGLKDFLRQYNTEISESFKQLELSYESWDYGENYYDGFHTVANVEGQFDFHMKYFRNPPSKPEKWHHIDVFPNFHLWNYYITSNRTESGYCILEDVDKQGFKISTREWLPDGPFNNDFTTNILTDSIYTPSTEYHVDIMNIPDQSIVQQVIMSDSAGRLSISITSGNCEVGIYKTGEQAKISVAGYTLDNSLPEEYENIKISPILFNKGGELASNVGVELISQDDNIVVKTTKQTITSIPKGGVIQNTSFLIRCRNASMDHGKIKVLVTANSKTETFLIDIPFYTPDYELTTFKISDGKSYKQEVEGLTVFGEGDINGIVDPGEKFSILTNSEFTIINYFGLRLYTDDPYVDQSKTTLKYSARNDWSGGMRITSELYVKPDCPVGHVIHLYGVYDYPLAGNISRDQQASQSFIHEIKRVSLEVTVGGNTTKVDEAYLENSDSMVFPMPNHGSFYINTGSFDCNIVQIFDLNGKELFTQPINPDQSIVSLTTNLKPGLYVLAINNTSHTITKKIVVN